MIKLMQLTNNSITTMLLGDDMNKVLKTRPELFNQLDLQESAYELGPN